MATNASMSLPHLDEWQSVKANKYNFQLQSQSNCKYKASAIFLQCGCCQRILIIFKYCQSVKDDSNKLYKASFNVFPGYNLTQFQNDMNHIMTHHDEEVKQGLFAQKLAPCDIMTCRYRRRAASDRHTIHNGRPEKTRIKYHYTEMARRSFIGDYHQYLLHPITASNARQYRSVYAHRYSRFVVTATNAASITPRLSEQNDDNKSEHPPPNTTDNDEDDEKYVDLSVHSVHQDDFDECGSDDGCKEDESEPHIFTFGMNFSYDKFVMSKNNKPKKDRNYVGCKYKDLKAELMDDEEKPVIFEDINAWNTEMTCCAAVLENDYCKSLRAKQTKYQWETEEGTQISIARVVVIRLYTTCDPLQRALCKTFRFDAEDRTNEKYLALMNKRKYLKIEHSRFAHFARLLRSTVDLFGEDMNSRHKFYRGLAGHRYLFRAFSRDFNGPNSTTTSLAVAWNFGGEAGIVVQIEKPEWRDGARFMNVKHLSGSPSEEERLFFGPDNYLQLTSIHHDVSIKQASTRPLILLQLLTHKISRTSTRQRMDIDIAAFIQSAPNQISELNVYLQHAIYSDDNEYQFQLTRHYLAKHRVIYINVKLVYDLIAVCMQNTHQRSECEKLLSWMIGGSVWALYKQKELHINFEMINRLFPEAKKIIFDFGRFDVRLSESEEKKNKTWDNLVKYMHKDWSNDKLTPQNKSKVEMIEINHLRKYPSAEFIDALQTKLSDTKWCVEPRWKSSDSQQTKCSQLTFCCGKIKLATHRQRGKLRESSKNRYRKQVSAPKNTTPSKSDDVNMKGTESKNLWRVFNEKMTVWKWPESLSKLRK